MAVKRSKKKRLDKPNLDPFSYWMCADCAEMSGGDFKKGHVCTMICGECEYCERPHQSLIPWVDFDWPLVPQLQGLALIGRD